MAKGVQTDMAERGSKPAAEAARREKPRGSFVLNSIVLPAVSLLCALAAWLIVTMYFDPQGTHTISNVSVNFGYQSSTYTAMNLDIVDLPSVSNVRVNVEGNGTIIGNMKAEDIMVYPNYAAVTGPGEVTLGLEARIVNNDYANQGIRLTVVSPTSVTLVFENVTTKTLDIVADTAGVTVADGYTLHRTVSAPAAITLRGPASELEKVDSVAAIVTAEDELADNYTTSAVLELRDENGEAVEPRYTTMDTETADVTLSVYQVRELPLAVDFIGTPKGFDVNSLNYSLSRSTLRVAGPARIVGPLTELSVTSFDLSQEFALGRDYQRQIELPNGIVSQDGVGAVTLSFDTVNMDYTTLNISNIQPINVPSNYDIEVLTSMVENVRLYGPEAEIARLSADSVVVQLDCQSVSLNAGQQVVPVTIQIPYSSRIFATGSYTVECAVTEK